MEKIAEGIFYVGVDDVDIDLFEGILPVPDGMAYNSYIINDEKCAVIDSVDARFGDEWLAKVENVLNGREPDYIVVLHMEPDHSANVHKFTEKYRHTLVVGNKKTFVMLDEFFGEDYADRRVVVNDGDKLNLGKHELSFIFAPMVHWPEVMTAYESYTKTYFSADGFGKFGALCRGGEWDDEARRYYYAIVGKYGMQVQALLKKVAPLEIKTICSLHGPVLKDNLAHYVDLYSKWSSYQPEEDGVLIAYTSVYGHTEIAVNKLAEILRDNNVKVEVCNLIRSEKTNCIAQAFRYNRVVFATTTYNGDMFPTMREFLDCLAERNYANHTIGLIENGSWAPFAAKAMSAKLEKCKNLNFTQTSVKIRSALNAESLNQLNALAMELIGRV